MGIACVQTQHRHEQPAPRTRTCCGQEWAYPYSYRTHAGYHRADRAPRTRRPLMDRFWALVDVRGPDECWPWTGGLSKPGGYGAFHPDEGRTIGAHRYSLGLALGRPVATGMEAMHSCDNPPCVNPAHLSEGTSSANHLEAFVRGRTNPPRSRLDVGQVVAIVAMLQSGTRTATVAQAFSVSRGTVNDIRFGRSWGHVTGNALGHRKAHP